MSDTPTPGGAPDFGDVGGDGPDHLRMLDWIVATLVRVIDETHVDHFLAHS
ncbi:hypothetical protein [Actinopolymorpha sp. B9G3]|uniref:hypothetical protein n=1 Tax=Actinopolymorpha sp. B9G3 TaxID=3158970 RepID=UPI0032D99F9D